MRYDWNFGRLEPYTEAFLRGTGFTLLLTLVVVICGTALGVVLGLLFSRRGARVVLTPILDVLKAVPPLVMLLFLYYLLTAQVIGTTFPVFLVAAIGLSLNLAAFVADLVRAAVENVDPSDMEAAYALGFSSSQVRRHVVLPHVAREVLPALVLLWIGELKGTSLASVLNVREVVFTAQTVIADIYRSLEAWVIVALIYCVLVIPSMYAARALERRMGRGRSARRLAPL